MGTSVDQSPSQLRAVTAHRLVWAEQFVLARRTAGAERLVLLLEKGAEISMAPTIVGEVNCLLDEIGVAWALVV